MNNQTVIGGNINGIGQAGCLPYSNQINYVPKPQIEDILRVIEKASIMGVDEIVWDGIRIKFKANRVKKKPPQWPHDVPPMAIHNQQNNVAYTADQRTPPAAYVPDVKAEQIFKPESPFEQFTNEEILMYATPRFDELQAEKEAHKEKLKEEASIRS